jgi:hypothetical protein
MTPFVFQRGETLSLALDILSGEAASVGGITAEMKAVPAGRTTAPREAPPVARFAIASRAAKDDVPAGWTLTIPAATCAGLPAGAYIADARIEVGGGVVLTESVAIRLREAVST